MLTPSNHLIFQVTQHNSEKNLVFNFLFLSCVITACVMAVMHWSSKLVFQNALLFIHSVILDWQDRGIPLGKEEKGNPSYIETMILIHIFLWLSSFHSPLMNRMHITYWGRGHASRFKHDYVMLLSLDRTTAFTLWFFFQRQIVFMVSGSAHLLNTHSHFCCCMSS